MTSLELLNCAIYMRSLIKMSSDTIEAVSLLDAQRVLIVNHMLLLAQLHVARTKDRE